MAEGMIGQVGSGLGVFAASIIGLATVAVILSRGSQTSQVLTSGGQAFAGVLGAATAPVTGTGTFGGSGLQTALSTSNINSALNLVGGTGSTIGSLFGQAGTGSGDWGGAGSAPDAGSGW